MHLAMTFAAKRHHLRKGILPRQSSFLIAQVVNIKILFRAATPALRFAKQAQVLDAKVSPPWIFQQL